VATDTFRKGEKLKQILGRGPLGEGKQRGKEAQEGRLKKGQSSSSFQNNGGKVLMNLKNLYHLT